VRSSSWRWGAVVAGACVLTAIACFSPAPAPTNAPTCNEYCTQVASKCLQQDEGFNNLVYKDEATCVDMCVKMTPGVPGDKTGDTLACRLGNLSALDDVGVHPPAERHQICLESAVLGCTDLCEGFCTFDEKVCPGPLFPYASHADCVTTCKGYDATFNGPFVGSTGNTLQCRTYHMENAVVSPTAQATHCPHTGLGQPNFGTATCNVGQVDGGTPDGGADASQDAKTD
jgi:hypothetical protein